MNKLMRKCTGCGNGFPLEEFHKSKTNKVGHHTKCKKCRSDDAGEYYISNKKSVRRQQREYYWSNREKILLKKKKQYWDKKDREEEEQSKDFTEYDDLPDMW